VSIAAGVRLPKPDPVNNSRGNSGFIVLGSRLRERHATISGMQDHETLSADSRIEAPWYVDSVELKLEVGEIHVRLAHHEMIDWPCPECGAACKLHDHQPERQWRHLDTASIRPSCTPSRRAARAAPWSARGEDAVGGAVQPIHGAV